MSGYKYKCNRTGCSSNSATNGNATLTVVKLFCTPTYGTGTNGITRVTFNTIDNSSTGTNGYTDYTESQSTSVTMGSPYNLNIYVNTAGAFTSRQKIWIDWNQDGAFNTTAGSPGGMGEEYTLGSATNVASGISSLCPFSITVPTGASVGTTRMRVSSYSNTTFYDVSCGTGSSTEYEDYTIFIQPTPTLSASLISGGFGNVVIGNTSGEENFTITGQYLTAANVTVGPLAGYTFSTTSGGTYTSTLSLAQAGGAYSQIIYVKLTPTAVQSYDGNIPIGGGGATSITVPVTGTGVQAMSYVSSTTTQSTPHNGPISPFTTNQVIIGVQIVTTGTTSSLLAESFTFNTTGTTSAPTDIICARLYYTGSSNTFSTATQFGTLYSQPNGSFTLTGSRTLVPGTNYFWLTYDVPSQATINNYLDAECTSITITSITRTPTITNPGTGRQIKNTYLHANNNSVPSCSGVYYDDGSFNNIYAQGTNYTKTFIPDAGKYMRLTFSSFETEATNDPLKIYNGPTTSATLLGTWSGTSSPGTQTATSATGELTVNFIADNYTNTYNGWEATVSCVSLPPNCASYTSPANGAVNQATNTSISWAAGATDATHNPPSSYKLYFGTDAAATNIANGIDIGDVTSWGTGLSTSTTYYWKIVPVNRSGDAVSCATIRSFTTAATYTSTTYTVCPSGCNYTTIQAAYNACTSASPYIIEVKNTYDYVTSAEPKPIDLSTAAVVSQRSAANFIIIRPHSTIVSTELLDNTTSSAPIFSYSGGTKYVTIDGRVGSAGTTSLFTFRNSFATSIPTIRMTGDVSYNTIKYCKIEGTNTTTGVVSMASPTGAGIRNITIDNNEITAATGKTPYAGVYSTGASSSLQNTLLTISNNKIYDCWIATASTYGVLLDQFNYSCNVTGNSMYLTGTRTPTAHMAWYGIFAYGNNHTISGNYIGGSSALCGGTALTIGANTRDYRICGIRLNGDSESSSSVISGNIIKNITLNTGKICSDQLTSRTFGAGDQAFTGIELNNGAGTVSGNTIGSTTVGNITVINNNTSPASNNAVATYGYSSEAAGIVCGSKLGVVTITNNTIQGLKTYSLTSNDNYNSRVVGITAYTDNASATGYTHNITNNIVGSTGGLVAGATGSLGDCFVWGILTNTGRGSIYITGNKVSNLLGAGLGDYGYIRGIHNNSGTRAEIVNDSVWNLESKAANVLQTAEDNKNRVVVGIMCDNDGGSLDHFFVNKNEIFDLRATTTASAKVNVIGIYYRHAEAPVYGRVFGNKIYSINSTSTDLSSTLIGIWAYGQNTITYNNMITLGSNISTTAGATCPNSPVSSGGYELRGIDNNFGKNEYYFNSINIIGTATSASNTYAYRYTNKGTEDLRRTFKNNIFSNTRTGGTGKHYAFSIDTLENDFISDYNYYYVTGANGVLFDYKAVDKTTLALWRTATSNDANSTGSGIIASPNPLFVSPTTCDCNLNITNLTSPVRGIGTTSGIPSYILDDYYSKNRASSPDIGAVVVGGTTLPVSLLSFNATRVDKNNVKLTWTTVSEINNEFFSIERSLNGTDFTSIGSVQGNGNSNKEIDYQYNDITEDQFSTSIVYYRFKQVDFDGAYQYSPTIIVLPLSENSEIILLSYLNSNEQTLYSFIGVPDKTDASLSIINLYGQPCIEENLSLEKGTSRIKTNVSKLAKGTYILKLITTEGRLKTAKFVKP